MTYIDAVFAGAVVGVVYNATRVNAPAPPIIVLTGLAGMQIASPGPR